MNRWLADPTACSLSTGNTTLTYFTWKLDQYLTYRQHLVSIRAKMYARNNTLRLLATQHGVLVLPHYASVPWHWYTAQSSTHAEKLDVALNETLQIIIGCLHPTPIELSGIAHSLLRWEHQICSLVSKASLTCLSNLIFWDNNARGHPFSRHAAELQVS